MEIKETDKKLYEMSYLVKAEDGADFATKTIKTLGGEIELQNPVSKIALSYPIKNETVGYFGFAHFLLDPSEVKNLEHEMETSTSVLRYLIITPPFKKAEPRVRPDGVALPKSSAPVAPRVATKPAETKTETLTNEELESKIAEILG